MAKVKIVINEGHHKGHKKCKKRLLIYLNHILISKFMDIQLFVDKGVVVGHLVVLDQNSQIIPTSSAGYSSSDEAVFTVTGDDSSFTINPTGVGTGTFNYAANGISGSGTVTVVPAQQVASSIDFVIDSPQQP